jgi:hypothetical protein
MFLRSRAENTKDADDPAIPGRRSRAEECSGLRSASGRTVPSHVSGAMKSRGALPPADSTKEQIEKNAEEREGRTPLDRPPPGRTEWLGADTAVSIEREVVFGHAYAILTPESRIPGWCGYDNPTFLSVDGVSDPQPLGPGACSAGALDMEVCMANPTTCTTTSTTPPARRSRRGDPRLRAGVPEGP